MNSEIITQRIWQHSKMTGVNKLILLALAQYSDGDGFCWPGYAALGEMVGGLDKRNAMRNLSPVIAAGEVMVWEQQGQRGGRGYTNIYLITVGLSPEQIQEIIARRIGEKRVSIETLLETKGDNLITLCNEMGDKVDTQKQANNDKGDNSITRTKESLIIDSTSRQESKRGGVESRPPTCKILPGPVSQALLEICQLDWDFVDKEPSIQTPFKQRIDFLAKKGAQPGDVREFETWRRAHHWSGKKDDSPPTLKQVGEFWGQYQEWVKAGKPAQQNGAKNGQQPTKDHRPEFEKRREAGQSVNDEFAAQLRELRGPNLAGLAGLPSRS